jgi:hypothetical protein
MATTTPNFGWAVPTSTDLVKDGAVAIETLGDSIDASLVDLKGGTTGQVLKKATNTDMDFVWSADSAGMTNPMTTTGDTIYSSSGSTPARLGIGSTGQVLTIAGGVPTWASPAGGGKVLQVVSTVLATTFSASGGSFTDVTDLSLSITPSSSSSKVLVFYNLALFVDGNLGFMNLVRDSTALSQGTASGSRTVATGGTPNYLNYAPTQAVAGNFLDSPATTSATTYKIQVYTSSGTIYVNRSAADDNQTNRPRFASVITAMEIGA